MAAMHSRQRLLQAAIRLIAERGYAETTVGDIEAGAGLTRRAGGFYRHFKSKEEVLVEALNRTAKEMIGEIRLAEVLALRSPRAELLLIARSILRHAEAYRPLRLILWREAYKLPALQKAARRANKTLATVDILPWVENVLRRARIRKAKPRELGLMIFGPVLIYAISLDRGDPAFGLPDESFLDGWADHWAQWLEQGGRLPS